MGWAWGVACCVRLVYALSTLPSHNMCSGNPATAAELTSMLMNLETYRARSGDVQVNRVDPIEACHLLRAWKTDSSTQKLVDFDPVLLQLYAMMLLSLNLLLRFDEQCLLRYADRSFANGVYVNAPIRSSLYFSRRYAIGYRNIF